MKQYIRLHKNSIKTVKKHYFLLTVICLIAAFFGTEFTFSLFAIKARLGGDGERRSNVEKVIDAVELHNFDLKSLPGIVIDSLSGEHNEAEAVISEISGRINGKWKSALNLDKNSREISAATTVFSAGRALVIIASYVFSSSIKGNFLQIIFIIAAFLIYELSIFFFIDTYSIIYRRIILEGRLYKNVYTPRFVMLLKVKCFFKVGYANLVKNICYFLWCLTVAGAFVKRYSYYMVPYILAENPGISPFEAMSASRKMMNGHKLECFYYECSFLPFVILDFLTLGVSGVFFINPIKAAFYAEYYVKLRADALENNIIEKDIFIDKYLFELADSDILDEVYSNTDELRSLAEVEIAEHKGIRKWIAQMFGVVLYTDKVSDSYNKKIADKLHYIRAVSAKQGEAYPTRLSPLEKNIKVHWIDRISYERQYSMLNLVIIFFLFSSTGWLWEVLLHFIQAGEFVNRGALYGPWLPIYGAGSFLIITMLYRLRKKPPVFFVSTVLLCGTMEYLSSYFLEQIYGTQWWNYDGYFLNLNGRICAEGVLLFGIFGIICIYLVCPVIDNMLKKIPVKILLVIGVILSVIFIFDKFYSDQNPHTGKGITVEVNDGNVNENK